MITVTSVRAAVEDPGRVAPIDHPDVPERYGDEIEGSFLYRDFCCECHEPIRVCMGDLAIKSRHRITGVRGLTRKPNRCLECAPRPKSASRSDPSWKNNSNPWRENATRALEGD